MKEWTSYNRVAGYLNKIFDLLNAEFFESTLSRPTITIQSRDRRKVCVNDKKGQYEKQRLSQEWK